MNPQSLSPQLTRRGRSSQRRPRTRKQTAWTRYAAFVLGYVIIFTFWQVEPVPFAVHLAAVVLAATSFIPLARWYAGEQQGLPVFELICVAYAVQYSVPVYLQERWLTILSQPVPLPWDTLLQALLLAELGMIGLIGGYTLARRSPALAQLPAIDLPMDPQRERRYLVLAVAGGGLLNLLLATDSLTLPASLGALARLLANQLSIALILLAYRAWSPGLEHGRSQFWLYVGLGVAIFSGLLTGLLENVYIPLILLVVVRWHCTRRIPWLPIAAGFVVLLILNPAKFEYRSRVWFGGEGSDVANRVQVWTDAVTNSAQLLTSNDPWVDRGDQIQETLGRFNQLFKLAYVRKLTPSTIPYYGGETYSYLLVAWIPRFVWPDKPVASQANEALDVDYQLKVPGASATIGIGQIGEAYANFGALGVLLVLALQGVVFAALDHMLNGPQSDGGRAVYLSVMVYFLNGVGTSAAILFGALLQQILANTLILRLFATGWRADSSPSTKAYRAKRVLTRGQSTGHRIP